MRRTDLTSTLRTGHYLWPGGGGGGRRENGWVNKILSVELGGLNKNSLSQGHVQQRAEVRLPFSLYTLYNGSQLHVVVG